MQMLNMCFNSANCYRVHLERSNHRWCFHWLSWNSYKNTSKQHLLLTPRCHLLSWDHFKEVWDSYRTCFLQTLRKWRKFTHTEEEGFLSLLPLILTLVNSVKTNYHWHLHFRAKKNQHGQWDYSFEFPGAPIQMEGKKQSQGHVMPPRIIALQRVHPRFSFSCIK